MSRPLKFPDPQMLEQLISTYFQTCDEGRTRQCEIKDRNGNVLKVIEVFEAIPYSVEGLADFLDCDPTLLRRYEKTQQFYPIVSRAINRIHRQWVEKGLTGAHNAKVTALCLAANNPAYRINSDNTLNIQVSFEDRLVQAITARRQNVIDAPAIALPDPDVVDV
jgi:hypothetical protein